jgi:hypothetical protein
MLAQRSTACAAILLLAFVSALQASDTTFVSQGARLKVFPLGAKPIIGDVARLSYDTLVILPEGDESTLTFDRRDLRKIEMYQGKRSSWLKSGLIGGGIGLAVSGGLAGAFVAVCASDYDCYVESPGGTVAAFAGLGAAVGFGVGAGVGALNTTERWVEAELPAPPPVALNVGKDGSVRLAFSLRL